LLQQRQPAVIDEALRDEVRAVLGVSESYLRRLLRESGYAMTPLVEGVRQDSLAEVDRTLLALLGEYELAQAVVDLERMKQCRAAVIQAKDHARMALRKLSGGAAAERDEMIQRMLVWLENPSVFPTWIRLRERAITESRPTAPE
jgi:hypothetical protein